MPDTAPLSQPTSDPEVRNSPARVQDRLAGPVDELGNGWYDSSFDLRRGLWVIETDLDPAITHGIVVRKRTQLGGV